MTLIMENLMEKNLGGNWEFPTYGCLTGSRKGNYARVFMNP